VNFKHVVFEIYKQTDIQTVTAILRTPTGTGGGEVKKNKN